MGLFSDIAGGITESFGTETTQQQTMQVAAATAEEERAREISSASLEELSTLLGAGAPSVGTQKSRTMQLEHLLQKGVTDPFGTEKDVTLSRQYAGKLMAPEWEALQQSFRKQTEESRREAATLGRSTIDPVLQAKLRGTQMEQEAMLGARETALSYQMARELPGQRIGYAQALQQRGVSYQASLAELGSSLSSRLANIRLSAAGRTTTGMETPGIGAVLMAGAGAYAKSQTGGAR